MNKKKSDISVSIVTYNNSADFDNRIQPLISMLKSSDISRVYIIDSNSVDDTPLKIKKIAESEPFIEPIFLLDNKGFGYGHNKAISKSHSNYHLVMNLDAIPKSRDTLKKMAKYMDEHSDVHLLSPLIRFPDGSIQYLTRNEPTVLDLGIRFLGPKWFKSRQKSFVNFDTGYDHEQIIYNASGSFMFFRLDYLKEIGGFDEKYFLYMEDTDITKSINDKGKAIFSPDFEVIHEWQRNNHSTKGAIMMLKSMFIYFNKWGWKLW